MRYTLLLGALALSLSSIFAVSATDNTELLPDAQTKSPTYSYRTFSSCTDMESTARKVLSGMLNTRYRGDVMYKNMAGTALPAVMNAPAPTEVQEIGGGEDFSATNVQVQGVDEADIVKTDGNYIYSYQEGEKAIVILDAKTLERKQRIRIPNSYYNTQIYVQGDTLVLTAIRSMNYNARWYGWYNNQERGIVAVYDITNRSNVSLRRVIQLDGSIADSRLSEDGIMTIIGTNYLSPPPLYQAEREAKLTYELSPRTLVPNIYDTTYSLESGYKTANRKPVDCSQIGAVLPNDVSAFENMDFSPVVTSIIRFDTKTVGGPLDSQIIFANSEQIHLSKRSLYITTPIWGNSGGSPCPPGAMCAMKLIAPTMNTTSTMIHRFAFDGVKTKYTYSHMIPGSPLSQYSMDEDENGDFRIVTSISDPKRSTNVSIISPTGDTLGSLSGLAPDENFQSARFIGNRLYLVTFEQIDPLFVIDLGDAKNPKVLGELKIPGYSTYLHPYDADRLIGIGYDTRENRFGGVQNAGLKIDLYNVADVKNPKQEQSLILGSEGSSSEVLNNPRAFVWYPAKNLLLMPATVIDTKSLGNNTYPIRAFQGVVGVMITSSGISEKFRVTHIAYESGAEAEWKKECAQYMGNSGSTSCVKLLDGSEYCPGDSQYIPPYCYAGSTVDSYIANRIWNYSDDFVNRALYIGEQFYTIGNSQIRLWDLSNTSASKAEAKFKTNAQSFGIPTPMPMMVR